MAEFRYAATAHRSCWAWPAHQPALRRRDGDARL